MKKIFLLVVSFTLAFNSKYAKASPLDQQVGIVVAKENLVCLIISQQKIKIGSKVSLVFPTIPQRLVNSVVILANDRKCAEVSKPFVAGNYYRLSPLYTHVQLDWPAIGVLNAGSHLRRVGVEVLGDLDGDGIKESFRSCTSYEGLHLTVWSGQPLIGMRRWHQYYYLGYDTEPTCTESEVNDNGNT